MKTWLFLIHLGVLILFLGAVFGIGFGLIGPKVLEINNYQGTMCIYLNHTVKTYNHCYQSCNTTIPSCNSILIQNISGICHTGTEEQILRYTQCFIVCDVYTILDITFQYITLNGVQYVQHIDYDCRNNQTCVNTIPSSTICYYNKNNPSQVTLTLPSNYRWEYLAAIIIICFLMFFYVIINLTVFKEYNYFCGKKW